MSGFKHLPAFGAKDLVYAVLDEDTDVLGGSPSYGAVKALSGLGMVTRNPGSAMAVLYGDDQAQHLGDSTGKEEVQIDLADIEPSAYAEILGHSYVNGQIMRNAVDQSPYIAIGWKRTHGATVFSYIWLFKGKLQKPENKDETKKESISFRNVAFKGTFVPLLANGNRSLELRTDNALVPAATITGFFNDVLLSQDADLGALGCVMAKSSGNLTFTFSKAGGGLFSINEDTFVLGKTAFVSKSGTFQTGSGVWTGQASASVVYTFTPATPFGEADVAVSVTREIKDADNVSCTPKTTVIAYTA